MPHALQWLVLIVAAVAPGDGRGAPAASDVVSETCRSHPDFAGCQLLGRGRGRDSARSGFAPSGLEANSLKEKYKSQSDNNLFNLGTGGPADRNRIDNGGQPQQQVVEEKTYCDSYEEHYQYYCLNAQRSRQGGKVVAFCNDYTNICPQATQQQYERYQGSLENYCKEYRRDFYDICKNPINYGPRALRFCPAYSDACRVALPQQQQQQQQRPSQGPQQRPQQRPQPQGGGRKRPPPPPGYTDADVDAQCQTNRALGEKFCFTPLANANPKTAELCTLYRTYCV